MSLITPEIVLREHRDRLVAAERARRTRSDPGRAERPAVAARRNSLRDEPAAAVSDPDVRGTAAGVRPARRPWRTSPTAR